MLPPPKPLRHPALWREALKISLVVGSLLNLINQGERVLAGDAPLWGHALLNYLVPFCVAAYSGARALRRRNLPSHGANQDVR